MVAQALACVIQQPFYIFSDQIHLYVNSSSGFIVPQNRVLVSIRDNRYANASRSPIAAARSRFTREPSCNIPRLLRDKVSGDKSHQNPSGSTVAAVRQTPFTAMLAPAFVSSSTVRHCTFILLPAAAMVPTSSMIPVNTSLLHVGFHGKFIRRNAMQLHAVEPNRIGAPQAARSTRYR